MKLGQKFSLHILFLFGITICCSCQSIKKTSKYDFEVVDNGPFKVKTYTLKNGLKLYLVPREDEPTIQTRIIVKAGANQDPEDARGLAHYLEHLLFNGTDKIGSFDFEKEKPLLGEIENLFELYGKTNDEAKKKNIYKKIDSLSYEASKYSRQNEYTDLMTEMGITFLNAFTNSHVTGYMNGIPSNQLEKWISLEAERFRNPVFRGFHTELETVYEEMNARSDNGYLQAISKLQEITFSSDYYKAPIGKVESLKNPSLLKTKEFYDTYYVPNNMAIIMSGDFDPDEATRLIEEKFSWMRPKELPKKKKLPSPILKSNIEATIITPEKESLAMYFVHKAANTEEAILAEFVEMLVLNGNLGIVDIGETNAKSNWFNTSYQPYYEDFSVHFFEGEPKEGISVEQLRNTVLKDLDRLKTGNFPDWMLEAVANDLNKRFISITDSNSGIVSLLQEAYSYGIPLRDFFSKQDKFQEITKSDVMEFAKKYYNNYSIVYKRQGENDFKKVAKPSITGLSTINNDKNSTFGKKIKSINVETIQPKLVDFKKEIAKISLKNGVNVNFVENEDNDLFNLRIVFDKVIDDKTSGITNKYIKLAGTDTYTSSDLKEVLYKIGTEYNIVTNEYNTTLYIDGLSKNLEKSLQLLKHLMLNLKEDNILFESLKNEELAKIENQKNNKYQLFEKTLNYVNNDSTTYFQSFLTKRDLEKLTTKKIINQVSELFNCSYEIYFYGSKSKKEITSIFNEVLEEKSSQVSSGIVHSRIRKTYNSNNVFLVDSNSKQIDITFTTNLKPFNKKHNPLYVLFNDYLDTFINESIRETKGMAYSATSTIQYPNYTDESYCHYTKVSTQTDKYLEALKINHDLINNMPMDKSVFLKVKSRWEGVWNSQRIVKNAVLYHYEKSINRGINYDYRKHYFEELATITLEDFESFYNEQIKNSLYNLIIIGDLNEIDRMELSKYGKVTELGIEDIFGGK